MGHVQVLEHLLSDSLEDRSRYLTALISLDGTALNAPAISPLADVKTGD